MLLKSGIQCECEKKTPLLYMLHTSALTNPHIMMLHLKKCSHLDITLQNYHYCIQRSRYCVQHKASWYCHTGLKIVPVHGICS